MQAFRAWLLAAAAGLRRWKRPALWLFVLIASELLMQWHGWQYWMVAFDRRIGWAIPMVLSILAAALWWNFSKAETRPRAWGWGIVACCASAVLLSSPVLQVGTPVIEQWHGAKDRPGRIQALQQDLASARVDVKRYQDLRAAGVIGYFDLLREASAKATQYEKDLQALRNQPASVDWLTCTRMGLLIAALILLQAGAALAAVWLARDWPTNLEPVRPEPLRAALGDTPPKSNLAVGARPSVITVVDVNEMQVRRLQHVIRAAAESAKLSVSAWGEAQVPKVHKRDISNLFAYFAQKNAGKRPDISKAKLTELVVRYLPLEAANGG
jgi:hypothetical protein